MSEMLGNQYFIARNYSGAARELEKALNKEPGSKPIRRKLIVCYTQIGQVQKALNTFLSLVKDDAEYIINTNPIDDDCPCAELVFDMEKELLNNSNSVEFLLMLGMLWLYCDVLKSISYFEKSQQLQPQNTMIKSLLSLLSAKAERSHS
jgi:tetratricopeptide (TPR) repeat protein